MMMRARILKRLPFNNYDINYIEWTGFNIELRGSQSCRE